MAREDDIFDALTRTCDILDELSCPYFLAGGTLLGARRNGDIIKDDVDFDLDCFAEDANKILEASSRFAEAGLTVRRKISNATKSFRDLENAPRAMDAQSLVIEVNGHQIGDIALFTLFSDGIARRFDLDTKVYFNPKMAMPGWFYAGSQRLSIRGREFSSPRHPDMVLAKVYGPDWQTPLTKGQFASGRHQTSGSVADADIETLIIHAAQNGWPADIPNRPVWPQPVRWVGWPAVQGREWILRHEPLLIEGLASAIDTAPSIGEPGADDQTKILMRVAAAKAVQGHRRIIEQSPTAPSISPFVRTLLRPAKSAVKLGLRLTRFALNKVGHWFAGDRFLQVRSSSFWSSSTDTYRNSAAYYMRQEAELRKILGTLPTRPRKAIDIGCSSGRFTFIIGEYCDEVTGVDISRSLIEQARKAAVDASLTHTHFEQVDLTKSYPDGQWGLVSCMGVTSTIIDDGAYERLLSSLAASVEPGGYLVTKDSVSLGESRRHVTPSYVAAYRSEASYFRGISALGLELVAKMELKRSSENANFLCLWRKPLVKAQAQLELHSQV